MAESNLTPETQTRIAARSRRQAMEWSLVLASQDIRPVIAPPDEGHPWGLLVDPSDYDRAMAAIHQYRLENRGWSWRRELPGGVVEIHSGAVFWCILLAFWHWATTFVAPGLNAEGRMDSAAVRNGEWYRIFTAILLHADLAHLMANLTFGVLVLGFSMARFGPGPTLLVAFLAGGIGNITGLAFYSHPYTGLGSSGMMMGALGILCTHSIGLWRKNPKAARYILSGVFAGFLIFVLFGLDPSSDVLAHFGGFAAGVAGGAVLSGLPAPVVQSKALNAVCLVALFGLLLQTWGLALR